MSAPKVFLAFDDGACHIKVKGRANFECSPPLRGMANNLDNNKLKALSIDLSECSGMDSTFMGILAMIALKVKQIGITATIMNAGDTNTKLLSGLGLQKLFAFENKIPSQDYKWTEGAKSATRVETAHTVLDAHETLMSIDDDNVKRFKNVVEFVKKDIDSEQTKK